MKLYAPLLALALAAPAFAQTATTEGTADVGVAADVGVNAEVDTGLSTRVGTVFYSDTEMTTLRTPTEITAQWSTLSPEDQTALRTRCETLMNAASEMEPSKGADAVEADAEGSAAVTTDSGSTTSEDLGFVYDDTRMRPVCEAIQGL
ncbi:hypothetical protein [Tabrizicola aquatica]|uniref:hypothetical protein n=1 Tax=Tabrizicola aquatica TaxID=909926 RepID=UPI000CD17A2D|nr:hypothetical protein [Tabrizicola aquatica]